MNQKIIKRLLLLLSHFSRAWLCATPQMAAHQAPPSMGFSRQEHWSGLPFPSPMHESEKWKWSRSAVCLTLWDPMDCSLSGSSVHGSFQAWVLKWGAIAFSEKSSNRIFKFSSVDKARLIENHDNDIDPYPRPPPFGQPSRCNIRSQQHCLQPDVSSTIHTRRGKTFHFEKTQR